MGTMTSFGFRHGAPKGVMIIDARVLPNPYGRMEYSGRHPAVKRFVLAGAEKWLDRVERRIRESGETAVAVGCVGGYHRSVAVAEELGRRLGWKIKHRDM